MKPGQIAWPELRMKLLALPIGVDPIVVSKHETIIDEQKFLNSHIHFIDLYPPRPNLTQKEKDFRKFVVKPHYDRLLAYYIIKTQLANLSN